MICLNILSTSQGNAVIKQVFFQGGFNFFLNPPWFFLSRVTSVIAILLTIELCLQEIQVRKLLLVSKNAFCASGNL